MKSLILLIASLAPSVAAAQGEPDFTIGPTLACLDAAGDFAARRDCIGAAATYCMESHPAGYSTLGQGFCISGELEYWDARLNESYRALRAEDRQDDIDMDAENTSFVPSQAEALLRMQRAWIPFRDGRCDYERSQWPAAAAAARQRRVA